MLTQKRLKEALSYNPDTGIFIRKESPSKWHDRFIGKEAGGKDNKGYVIIKVDGKPYKAHRLVFLYMDGYLPEGQVDHIDRVKHNNAYSNLRSDVTPTCQRRNTGNNCNNTSGVKGVYWHPQQEWRASITVNGHKKHLGCFANDFDEAVCARLAAEQCVNWHGCDSSSPAYQHVQSILN